MPIIFDREREIRYFMRRFGLTREEAEGMLNFEVKSQQDPKPKASVIIERKQDRESKDPDNALFWSVVAVLAGFAGLALADWLLKQLSKKKPKREEIEEWLV